MKTDEELERELVRARECAARVAVSRRRAVMTAIEHGWSQARVAAVLRISRQAVHKMVDRYQREKADED